MTRRTSVARPVGTVLVLLAALGCSTGAGAAPAARPLPTWPPGVGRPLPAWTPALVAHQYRAAHADRAVGSLEVRLIDGATALVTETRPGPDRAATLRRHHRTWVEDVAVDLG